MLSRGLEPTASSCFDQAKQHTSGEISTQGKMRSFYIAKFARHFLLARVLAIDYGCFESRPLLYSRK